MKYFGLFCVWLFTGFSYAGDTASLLPEKLPLALSIPAQQEALERWVSDKTEIPHDQQKILHSTRGQNGITNVYFIMAIIIDDELKDENHSSFQKIQAQIRSTLENYNRTGEKIGIEFTPYLEFYYLSDYNSPENKLINRVGQIKQDVTDLAPLYVVVSHPTHPMWKDNPTKVNSVTKVPENKTFVSMDSLPTLTHEWIHLLLRNADAAPGAMAPGGTYRPTENDAYALLDFNAVNGSYTEVHPLELYVGLKRQNIESPKWESYVRSTYNKWFSADFKLFYKQEASQLRKGVAMMIDIYNMAGENIFSHYYSDKMLQMEWENQKAEGEIPSFIDVSKFKLGTYVLDATYVDVLMINDKPQPIEHRQTLRFVGGMGNHGPLKLQPNF